MDEARKKNITKGLTGNDEIRSNRFRYFEKDKEGFFVYPKRVREIWCQTS